MENDSKISTKKKKCIHRLILLNHILKIHILKYFTDSILYGTVTRNIYC